LTRRNVDIGYGDWRKGDQFYFVADTRKIESAIGWQAKVGWRDGLADLAQWLAENRIRASAPQQRAVSA
jgi:CDP-paratose 2-epimerase